MCNERHDTFTNTPADQPDGPSDFDRAVYKAIAMYAWDEAECHPSQWTIARDIGCSREAVNRAVRRLVDAKWLRISERRWSPRSKWSHNVYELYEHFAVGALTIKRIVRRAHKRRTRWADWEAGTARSGLDHTNAKRSTVPRCSCGWCKEELPLAVKRRERIDARMERRERREACDLGQRIAEGMRAVPHWRSEDRRFMRLWHGSPEHREAVDEAAWDRWPLFFPADRAHRSEILWVPRAVFDDA